MRRTRAVGAAATAVALSLVLAAPRAAAASSAEMRMAAMINDERTERGLRTLTIDPELVTIAHAHSVHMASKGRLFHNDDLGDLVDATLIAENVGLGGDLAAVQDAFIASATHRDNILNHDVRRLGVGVVASGGTIYVTHVFASSDLSDDDVEPTAQKEATVQRPSGRAPLPRSSPSTSPASPTAAPVALPSRAVGALLRLGQLDASSAEGFWGWEALTTSADQTRDGSSFGAGPYAMSAAFGMVAIGVRSRKRRHRVRNGDRRGEGTMYDDLRPDLDHVSKQVSELRASIDHLTEALSAMHSSLESIAARVERADARLEARPAARPFKRPSPRKRTGAR